jgi:arylsulfatase A-like enzyme
MKLTHGHGDSIINGISRIGYMTGGQAARWKDEEIADTFARRAVRFIDERVAAQTAAKANAPAGKAVDVAPFFLYLPTHNVHVPRVPGPRFAGHSGCGVRGDVIEEFDDTVGQVLSALDRLGVADNTLVIVSSDNGPVLDDGYDDGAERDLKGHRPGGPWRGGKTSKYEGGTRVPLLVRWPARVNPGGSSALVCQVDLLASLAALVGVDLGDTPLDSRNLLPTLLGESAIGRETLVEQGAGPGALAFRKGPWKLVPLEKVRPEPRRGSQNPAAELYNLEEDPGETHDLSGARPELVAQLLQGLREAIQPLATLPAAADSPE